jgi:hypothetical protein
LITYVKSKSKLTEPEEKPRNVKKQTDATGTPGDAVDEQSDRPRPGREHIVPEPKRRNFMYRLDTSQLGTHAHHNKQYSSAVNDKRLEKAFQYAAGRREVARRPFALTQRVRHAMETGEFKEFIAAYRALPEGFTANRSLMAELANFLKHNSARVKAQPEDAPLLLAFARDLWEQMQTGRWMVDARLAVAILKTYILAGNLDAAVRLWEWLEAQPDSAVTANTYAAAMHLYSARGEPLSVQLELYEKALARFPGEYLSYHLSPGAVLSDREAEIKSSIPYALLVQLSNAYIQAGSTRDGYLVLDTIYRLHPLMKNHSPVTIMAHWRPTSEIHTQVCLKARMDVSGPVFHADAVQSSMTDHIKVLPTKPYFAIMRYFLAAIYAQKINHNKSMGNVITTWIKCLKPMMYLAPLASATSSDRAECARALFSLVKKLMSSMEVRGESPRLSLFNAMLSSFAAFDDSGETLDYITNAIAKSEAGADRSVQLSLVNIYGKQHKSERLKAAWSDMISNPKNTKEAPTWAQIRVLIIASNRAGCADFAREQLARYKGSYSEEHYSQLEGMFDHNPETDNVEHKPISDDATLTEFMRGVDALSRDAGIMYNDMQKKAQDPTYKGLQFSTTIFPPEGALRLSDAEMRTLYDEFTTIPEAQSSAPVSDSKPDAQMTDSQAESTGQSSKTDSQASTSPSTTSSPTPSPHPSGPASSVSSRTTVRSKHTLGELRYQHWRDINYLLQLADRHDNLPGLPARSDDAASVRQRLDAMNFDDFSRLEGLTLGAAAERMANPPVEAPPRSGAELDEARAEIRRLRTPVHRPAI